MSKITVMVVDDNEGDQFLCQHTIGEYNKDIEIIEAHNGQGALDILETITYPPSFIFLDINMPKMDGFEFLEHYQSKYPNSVSKVILLSSSMIEQDQLKGRSFAAVKDYIIKPLRVENVTSVLTGKQ